jgi:hypothetical protein
VGVARNECGDEVTWVPTVSLDGFRCSEWFFSAERSVCGGVEGGCSMVAPKVVFFSGSIADAVVAEGMVVYAERIEVCLKEQLGGADAH